MSDSGASQSLGLSSGSVEAEVALKPSLAVVETVGSLLSAARRQKELSVQQVAEQLKLSPRQISAIESNQYDALPQMVIVRGFIRAYAKLLKIDANAVVALLPMPVDNAQLESALKPALSTPFLESRLSLMGRQDNSHKYLWGAVILAVLAGGFFLLQKFEHAELVSKLFSSEPTPAEKLVPVGLSQANGVSSAVAFDNVASQVSVNVASASASVVALDVQAVSKQLAGVAASSVAESVEKQLPIAAPAVLDTSGISSAQVPLDTGNDILKLKFRQDTWIQLKKEGGAVITSHLGKAGTEEVFNVKEPLSLKIGNAAGVEAVLRGRAMEILPVNGSNVVNLNLK